MISFWEKESFTTYDYIIIGGGIVGLSTAIAIKENEPKSTILILEKGTFPSGASTKNAGFACFGSLTELLSDLETLGESGVQELVLERWEGLKKLRSRLDDENLDYHNYGGYELLKEQELPCLGHIEKINELLAPVFNQPVFYIEDQKIYDFGFNDDEVKSIIVNRFEGQLHTGKMMRSLMGVAQKLGIDLLTGTEVTSLFDDGSQVEVMTGHGDSPPITFKAQKVGVCTNAFTKKLIDDIDIYPGRGIVLVTKPIPHLPFKGVFHLDEGYYYFRNVNDRVIFGGGRNLDFKKETTTSLEVNQSIVNELKRQLSEVILPNHTFEVEQVWSGIMAFGENKKPIIRSQSTNVFLGVRMGGMGVAIGSQIGEKLAKKMM